MGAILAKLDRPDDCEVQSLTVEHGFARIVALADVYPHPIGRLAID